MAGGDAQLFQGTAQDLSSALGDVLVGGAVEAVTTHLILAVPTVRHGINVCLGGHSLMEGGVEHSHHGGVGHDFLAGLDAGDVGGVVEGSQRDALPDTLHNSAVNQHGVGELLAAVHHAVAHSVDLGHILDHTVVVVGQNLHDQLDGGLVVGHVAVSVVDVLVGGGMLDVAVNADALAQALGQNFLGIRVQQLILQGRAACVDNQNFHGNLHSLQYSFQCSLVCMALSGYYVHILLYLIPFFPKGQLFFSQISNFF